MYETVHAAGTRATGPSLAGGYLLADRIDAHADRITDILTSIATLDSVRTEIHDATTLLRTAEVEAPNYLRADRSTPLRVYLPSNNALYSLSLFMMLPSLFLDDVLVRPSSRIKSEYFALYDLLSDDLSPHARMADYTQREFVDLSHGAVVVFNGRPENGYRLSSSVNDGRFLGFGSGPNPAVIGQQLSSSQLHCATEQLVESRMYNNGQDCLCPDVIFVHRSVRETVVTDLVELLAAVPVADSNRTPGLVNVPMFYEDAYDDFSEQMDELSGDLVWHGDSTAHATHAPISVVVRDIDSVPADCPEFFGPMFNVVVYDEFDQVEHFLGADSVAAGGMYIFGHGEPGLRGRDRVSTFRNTGGLSPFEFESGHAPFGGYGTRGSWVHTDGADPVGQPILLSEQLAAVSASNMEVAS